MKRTDMVIRGNLLIACGMLVACLDEWGAGAPPALHAEATPAVVSQRSLGLFGGAELLYEQSDGYYEYITSQDFDSNLNGYDSEAADDFNVPWGQTWIIDLVQAPGALNGGAIDFVNVRFYADGGGLPGGIVSDQHLTLSGSSGDLVIALGAPVVLTGGHYWLSVQAHVTPVGPQWWWRERSAAVNSPSAWHNPPGGYGTNCTMGWGERMASCHVGNGKDQEFALYGQSSSFDLKFGADSSTKDDEYPWGVAPFDVYLGQIGGGINPCYIHDGGKDPFNVVPTACIDNKGYIKGTRKGCRLCSGYQVPTSRKSRSNYAFWLLFGPQYKHFPPEMADPYVSGKRQAADFVERWRKYNSAYMMRDLNGDGNGDIQAPVIDGRTLFADVEGSLQDPNDSNGWCTGKPTCHNINRKLLEGFFDGIVAAGLTPGLYTRPELWVSFFGKDFIPRREVLGSHMFTLWIAGCASTSSEPGYGLQQVEERLPIVESTTLGGMQSVLWQYQVTDETACTDNKHVCVPDFDVTRQNPVVELIPRPNPIPTTPYVCTCEAIGGWCP